MELERMRMDAIKIADDGNLIVNVRSCHAGHLHKFKLPSTAAGAITSCYCLMCRHVTCYARVRGSLSVKAHRNLHSCR